MFGSTKKKSAKQASKAIEEAKRGLSMNNSEGRKIAYNAIIPALQFFEANEYREKNSKLFMYLGDVYFQSGENDTALAAYADAVNSPGGVGDPEIHLRLGKMLFDRNDEKQAADNLARALIMGGKKVFEGEDEKYFDFITTKLDPPPDGWDAYEAPAD